MKLQSAGATAGGVSRTRTIRAGGFFALSFGSIVGSGWIVLLGEWLNLAGPGGAVLALLAGGAVMSAVGLCYAELAARMPRAGGEVLYTLEVLGRGPAFLVGWFIVLFLVAVCVFEATALAWLLRALFPPIAGPALYSILGQPISADALSIGIVGALGIGALNLRGVRSSVTFQRLVTFGFLAIVIGLMLSGFIFGNPMQLGPLFDVPGSRSWLSGALWIFASCAMFLNGFQSALYAIEDRAPGIQVDTVVRAMVWGIVLAAIFYALIVLAASSAAPWRQFIQAGLPAVAAFDTLLPGIAGPLVLVAALISLLKTWNAVLMMATRMIVKQAGEGFLPAALGRTDAVSGAPSAAIFFVTGFTLIGGLLGRGFIVPIVNMATICIAFSLVLSLCILLRVRRDRPSASFSVPGGNWTIVTALCGLLSMAAFALSEPLLRDASQIPLEWILIVTWAAAGELCLRFAVGRPRAA